MTITVADFRANFPEFTSSSDFSNATIQFWLDLAYQMLNASRWLNQLDIGAQLFTAHNIALEAKALKESQNGGIPGQNTGPINSKSVDKVSVGYDTGAGIVPDAGHWNLTTYGTRFIWMLRMFGAGPIQVGIGSAPSMSGTAWPGPLTTPGFSNFGN